MVELIREKANFLEDELWQLAKDKYALERNEETRERILATISRFINAELIKLDLPNDQISSLEVDSEVEDIDFGLSFSFFIVDLARDEEQPDEAMDLLLLVAKTLGMLQILSLLPPKEYVENINLAKLHASALAKIRHAENYALADYAVEYWRKNIDPKLSASKAANKLTDVVNLSHKRLAEVISAEKKKQSK